ncbi:unnamed protein product [Brachionus calyciflorus]|uniref:EF-hand domain-containing protein n=1 Tax=Brachionus calyciflorus TaxID=104777 RepID=A0A813X2P6_9BILA|nr:unnamed protein product [Brachionus calyciflorus]
MPREQIQNKTLEVKLRKWYNLTLDTNNDGVVTWDDFLAAVEAIVPKEDAEKNSRLKILRKRVEQNFQKYFWDLCEVGDLNKDGAIDLDEWLDVMNDIILHVREQGSFPEWYEGLHKALFRANEFFDDRNVLKDEFVVMMSTWEINEDAAQKAYDYITENGAKKMDYNLFSEFMKQFFTNEQEGHVVNLGLDQ